MSKYKTKVKRTKIHHTSELKKGDVIYIYEKKSHMRSKELNQKLPECNFHRITTVRNVRNENNKWYYDTVAFDLLKSETDEHKIINRLLDDNIILTSGKFGCNHQIDESENVYRLDNIEAIFYEFNPNNIPNLKGNPAYDLTI